MYKFIGKMTVIIFLELACMILWKNYEPAAMIVNLFLIAFTTDHIEAIINGKKE